MNNETKHSATLSNSAKSVATLTNLPSRVKRFLLREDATYLLTEAGGRLVAGGTTSRNLLKTV